MKQPAFFVALLIAAPVLAQQGPVPDPRVEVALSTSVIKETQRTVAFDKAIAQPGVRARPAVEEPYMARVGEGVYVDRRLMPPRGAGEDPEAVRIRRSDR